MEYEVGVVRAHPVVWMFKSCVQIWKTWRHAKRHGLHSNEWFGVYQKGTEICLANTGSLPGAEGRARLLVAVLRKNDETPVKAKDPINEAVNRARGGEAPNPKQSFA